MVGRILFCMFMTFSLRLHANAEGVKLMRLSPPLFFNAISIEQNKVAEAEVNSAHGYPHSAYDLSTEWGLPSGSATLDKNGRVIYLLVSDGSWALFGTAMINLMHETQKMMQQEDCPLWLYTFGYFGNALISLIQDVRDSATDFIRYMVKERKRIQQENRALWPYPFGYCANPLGCVFPGERASLTAANTLGVGAVTVFIFGLVSACTTKGSRPGIVR